MRKIIMPQPKDDSLAMQLLSLYQTFKGALPNEKVNFELSMLNWVCPFLILPLSTYIQDTKSVFSINNKSCIKSYLEIVKFPKGIDSISEFQVFTQQHKNYIPISVLKRKSSIERDRLEGLFKRMLYKILGAISGVQDAIYYPIGELVTNIFEHSKKDEGFLFGQFYPQKDYLDICIVDRGRGLKSSYQQEKNLQLTDQEAIVETMRGHSVKSNIERGYGIWTSKRIICDALKGQFILISGQAALISSHNRDKLVSLRDFHWQGVIIVYRIPKPNKPIDIYPFVE